MITLNLPLSTVTDIIYVAYVIILFPSILVRFFPAVRAIEQRYIDHLRHRNLFTKLWRAFVVILNIVIAVMFGRRFDLILSLLGSISCIPLGLVVPGLIHYKLLGRSNLSKAIDIFLIVVGSALTILTSTNSLYTYYKSDN